MVKKSFLFYVIFPLLLTTLACRLTGEATATPTPIPLLLLPDETPATAVPLPPTAVLNLPATATPQPETAVASPTTPPTAALPDPATPATPVPPTDIPAPPTLAQTGEFFSPGQQDRPALEPGGFAQYSVLGAQFQPILFFAETSSEADLILAVVAGTDQISGGLAALQPVAQADFSPAARPEILVYAPDADGPYSLIVGNQGPARGETAVYLFDTATDAPQATHYRGETLGAGENKQYAIRSNGGRPVIVFVDPLDQSDLVLRIKDAAGGTLTEANFSGSGSAESAFVLPLRTTDYLIEVGEVNGRLASFTLVVIALE